MVTTNFKLSPGYPFFSPPMSSQILMASLDQQDDKTVELILKSDPDSDDYVKEITDDPLLDEECPVSCPLPEQKSNAEPVTVPTPRKPKQMRKSFACTQCEEQFPTNKKMLVHMIKHSEKHEVCFDKQYHYLLIILRVLSTCASHVQVDLQASSI